VHRTPPTGLRQVKTEYEWCLGVGLGLEKVLIFCRLDMKHGGNAVNAATVVLR